jgi:transcriptional regulator with XRE-family HTH domain
VATVLLPSLRSWRTRRGYTVQDLASLSGLRRNTIARIEAGYPARLGTAHRLADALGVPLASLQRQPPGS